MGLLQKTNIIRHDFREDIDQQQYVWAREILGKEKYGFKEIKNLYEPTAKGGAGFESAISGRLVSPAVRLLKFFYFMSILGYLQPG